MVTIIFRKDHHQVRSGMALLDALKRCNILPEEVVAIRSGEILTEDEILNHGDVIHLVAVVSGG